MNRIDRRPVEAQGWRRRRSWDELVPDRLRRLAAAAVLALVTALVLGAI